MHSLQEELPLTDSCIQSCALIYEQCSIVEKQHTDIYHRCIDAANFENISHRQVLLWHALTAALISLISKGFNYSLNKLIIHH